MDIESDRIDIKIRDVLCKNESDVLPLFKRKSRHSNGLVFYVKGGHSLTTENGREHITAEGDLLYLPYGSSYENRVLGSGIEFYEINFEIFDNGDPAAGRIASCNTSLRYTIFTELSPTRIRSRRWPICFSCSLPFFVITITAAPNRWQGGVFCLRWIISKTDITRKRASEKLRKWAI